MSGKDFHPIVSINWNGVKIYMHIKMKCVINTVIL